MKELKMQLNVSPSGFQKDISTEEIIMRFILPNSNRLFFTFDNALSITYSGKKSIINDVNHYEEGVYSL